MVNLDLTGTSMRLVLLLFWTFLSLSKCNTITTCSSSNTCTCDPGEACTINCNGDQKCDNARINAGSATSITINCAGGQACEDAIISIGNVPLIADITCSGWKACHGATFNAGNHNSPFTMTCSNDDDACFYTEINAGNASDVTIYCTENSWACDDINLNCGTGTGSCIVHCNGVKACVAFDLDCGSASYCSMRCDYGFEDSCRDLTNFDCGVSVCSMHCDTATDTCKNGNDISPITTNSVSFECVGSGCTSEFIAAYFTTSPTNNPSNNPSVTPSLTPSNIPSANPTESPSMYPTTSTPTTTIPTTAIPTTVIPTTVTPTTSAPTTTHPTTSFPSTSAPTTTAPTSQSVTFANPTSSTMKDGEISEDNTRDMTDSSDKKDNAKKSNSQSSHMMFIYVSIGGVLCLCFICCFALYYKQRNKHKRNMDNLDEDTGIKRVTSTSSMKTNDSLNFNTVVSNTNTLTTPMSVKNEIVNVDGFGENLTNLAGANNILMDDVINDMDGNEINDMDNMHVTSGGLSVNDDMDDINMNDDIDNEVEVEMQNIFMTPNRDGSKKPMQLTPGYNQGEYNTNPNLKDDEFVIEDEGDNHVVTYNQNFNTVQ